MRHIKTTKKATAIPMPTIVPALIDEAPSCDFGTLDDNGLGAAVGFDEGMPIGEGTGLSVGCATIGINVGSGSVKFPVGELIGIEVGSAVGPEDKGC